MKDSIIKCVDVSKRYREKAADALSHISFEIREGECVGLVGPNGSGKTTLISIVSGVLSPSSGAVQVFGVPPLQDRMRLNRLIGIHQPSSSIEPRARVEEVLQFHAAFYDRALGVAEVLAMIGLEKKRTAYYGDLSAGQRQRLLIALAFLHDPKLLLLDEPANALDLQSQAVVNSLFADMRQQSKTMLLSSHDLTKLGALCDRVLVLDGGRIIEQGPPAELIAKHAPCSRIALEFARPLAAEVLTEVLTRADCTDVTRSGQRIEVLSRAPERTLATIFDAVVRNGAQIQTANIRPATLADVYLKLTGKNLE